MRLRERGRHPSFAGVRHKLCQAEVEDLQPSVRSETQVGRFQIAMHDTPLMRRREPLHKLLSQFEYFFGGQGATGKFAVERETGNVLGDNEIEVAFGRELVHGCDIGMVQLGE